MSLQMPPVKDALRVDAIERLQTGANLNHSAHTALCRAQPFVGQRQMINLGFMIPVIWP